MLNASRNVCYVRLYIPAATGAACRCHTAGPAGIYIYIITRMKLHTRVSFATTKTKYTSQPKLNSKSIVWDIVSMFLAFHYCSSCNCISIFTWITFHIYSKKRSWSLSYCDISRILYTCIHTFFVGNMYKLPCRAWGWGVCAPAKACGCWRCGQHAAMQHIKVNNGIIATHF